MPIMGGDDFDLDDDNDDSDDDDQFDGTDD
jgi:hypothetical protein